MAIDKITPTRLDRSSDFKLIPSTSMVDALNLIVTEDESGSGGDNVGDLGVLKNVKGHEVMQFATTEDAFASGNAKIIGSVTDSKLKIVYFFVWHEKPNEHGVWAYDPYGKLPNSTGTSTFLPRIKKIHKSNIYKFPQHGFVKGDIIYTSKSILLQEEIIMGAEKDFEKDTILYFTDNTNEPKKINVSAALTGVDLTYNFSDRIDFVTACPKTPLDPITFTFSGDAERSTSNFKSGPGFQFAYQYIYSNGVESAISPYSAVAVAPVILSQGTLTNVNYNVNNRCDLLIPVAGGEIKSVKILARKNNTPGLVVLDQVDWDDNTNESWNPNLGLYYFYNDRIAKGVSVHEVNKQYDNLPRIAQAQAVVDNRLMYGNYLEGFDNITTTCTSDVIYSERPLDFVNLNMTLIPAISEQLQADSVNQLVDGFEGSEANAPFGEIYGDAINKSAGYILDASDFPDILPAGVTLNITIKIAPDENFHVYQASNSYHQSRHKGAWMDTDQEINYSKPLLLSENQQYGFGGIHSANKYGGVDSEGEFTDSYGHQTEATSGSDWLSETVNSAGIEEINGVQYGVPLAGNNRGVGATGIVNSQNLTIPMPRWRSLLLDNNSGEEYHDVVYGTSAGNPLVLEGGDLFFTVVLTNNIAFTGAARAAITSSVAQVLGGEAPTWNNGEAFTVNSVIGPTYEHIIDTPIPNFSKHPDTSPISRLVTSAMSTSMLTDSPYANPVGHFVVSKAKVTFSLERDNHYAGAVTAQNGTYPYELIRLVIDKIEPADGEAEINVVTVVKKKHPRSPWIAITKDYWTSGNFNMNEFEQGMTTNLGAIMSGNPNTGPIYPAESNTMEDFDYIYPTSIDDYDTTTGDNYFDDSLTTYVSGRDNGVGSYNGGFYERNIVNNLQARYFIGYLDFQQSTGNEQFFRYNKTLYKSQVESTLSINDKETFIFSLLDGSNGPGGALGHKVDGQSSFSSAPRRTKLEFDYAPPIWSPGGSTTLIRFGGPFYLGRVDCGLAPRTTTVLGLMDENNPTGGNPTLSEDSIEGYEAFNDISGGGLYASRRTYLPQAQGRASGGVNFLGDLPNQQNNLEFYSSPWQGSLNTNIWGNQLINSSVDFFQTKSHVELLDFLIASLFQDAGAGGYQTFKSNANHDFGIIYYDERGRHGFVNHLKTVHVAGYSSAERQGPLHGRSSILLNLLHRPPDWAYHYKIAYTKNTSIIDFVQYSSGGAYKAESEDNTNIYVSLNYLQESKLSYVADWGARTPEGGISLAKYLDGGNQKLRIISAYTDGDYRFFPNNFEFNVIDIILLGDTDNPLASDTDIAEKPWLKGEFAVLKNNGSNSGFDHNSIYSENDLWGNRCIFELYTPQRSQDDEERFYYEIGDTYDVFSPGNNAYHTDPAINDVMSIILDKGDVWWRPVPVNFREWNVAESKYKDLITYNPNVSNSSASNFLPYYLECESASDLFKSNASSIGRPNLIIEDAVESTREASITYSGQSNPNSSKINYSSFNLTLSNFKDLQEEFGDINYMCNISGDVFVIQSDKCTLVPASKTQFSDVQGGTTVAASKSPLGQERVFSGRSGCDNNPESAVQVGSYVYFAHKTLAKVFRWSAAKGVEEISEQGMASYFRELFKKALATSENINKEDIRVVGGYDPVQDEYLLTVLHNTSYEQAIVEEDETGLEVIETEEETEEDEEITQGGGLSYDFDGDGSVGSSDLLDLLSEFGTSGDGLIADGDGDDTVNVTDLLGFLTEFGTSEDDEEDDSY